MVLCIMTTKQIWHPGFYLLGGVGGSFPPKKSFTEKKITAISKQYLFDDDFKESVKVTNVQKCDFSQS